MAAIRELLSDRRVKLRTAVVMSSEAGSPFGILLGLVRRGLGGRAGDGSQYVSWIHERDFVRAVDWLLHHPELAGAVNLAAPNPLPNAEFMAAIRQAAGMPFGLPASRWMLEFGAFWMRTETELILKSRRVVPTLLTRSGFRFDYPSWPEAAKALYTRWRRRREPLGPLASPADGP